MIILHNIIIVTNSSDKLRPAFALSNKFADLLNTALSIDIAKKIALIVRLFNPYYSIASIPTFLKPSLDLLGFLFTVIVFTSLLTAAGFYPGTLAFMFRKVEWLLLLPPLIL